MRLRGLPDDMKVGCVYVRPRTKTRLPFLPCGFCKFFHVEYFLCDLGHVTCRSCGNDELNKVRGDEVQAPCFGCGTRMNMQKTVISAAQLRSERMLCPCGKEGTLRELQTHLKASKYLYGCVIADKTPEDMEVNRAKRSLHDLGICRNLVEFCEDRFGALFDAQLMKNVGSERWDPDELGQVEKYIANVETKLGRIETTLKELNVATHQILPTLDAIFREDGWLILKRDDVVSKPLNMFREVILGTPFEIHFKHANEVDGLWLGIYLRCRQFESPHAKQREQPFPLKARVMIRLHDKTGLAICKGSIVTYENNKYTSNSFYDPAIEEALCVGNGKFVLLSEVKEQGVASNDRLCFSFQFEPLYNI